MAACRRAEKMSAGLTCLAWPMDAISRSPPLTYLTFAGFGPLPAF